MKYLILILVTSFTFADFIIGQYQGIGTVKRNESNIEENFKCRIALNFYKNNKGISIPYLSVCGSNEDSIKLQISEGKLIHNEKVVGSYENGNYEFTLEFTQREKKRYSIQGPKICYMHRKLISKIKYFLETKNDKPTFFESVTDSVMTTKYRMGGKFSTRCDGRYKPKDKEERFFEHVISPLKDTAIN